MELNGSGDLKMQGDVSYSKRWEEHYEDADAWGKTGLWSCGKVFQEVGEVSEECQRDFKICTDGEVFAKVRGVLIIYVFFDIFLVDVFAPRAWPYGSTRIKHFFVFVHRFTRATHACVLRL
jgi:hypothetical protein